MNLLVALAALYPYCPTEYWALAILVWMGSGDEQPITSVTRFAPKGVILERMKGRLREGGKAVRVGGTLK